MGIDRMNNLDASKQLEQEVIELVDNWGNEAEMQKHPVNPSTPLQKLLAEHHGLGQQIVDIEDDALERDMRLNPQKYPGIELGDED